MKQKILIFCPYYPPHIGGLESHAQEFNEQLSDDGNDVTVFTPDLPQSGLYFEKKNNIQIFRYPAFELISNWPVPKFWGLQFWKIFIGLFHINFDLVISRTRFFLSSFLALLYSKIRHVRWIHIEHGSDFVRLESRWNSFLAWIYDQTVGRLIFVYSDQNIAISRAVHAFVSLFDRREIPIIYRGIRFDDIDNIGADNDIVEKYKNKIVILFVGRLYKWKGVENSINAIKLLPQNILNKIVFLIVGDGEDRKRLEKLVDKSKYVKFIGSVDRNKSISILKSGDIFIHSSLPGGGLSTSLLEAVCCNNIIISTSNEGANELKINKIEINDSDPKLIKDALLEAIKNLDKYKLDLGYNKQYLLKNFSWDKSIKKYEKYF